MITVRSAAPDGVLPAARVRMTPEYARYLPKIRSTNSVPALRAALGSHHWHLLFLELPATHRGYGEILRIGEGSSAQSSLAQVPYEIVVDRVYIHGDPLFGQKRGIALNGRSITIRNSYISDIKAIGMDTQAIGGWNGPGPFLIENNYLEAAGENFILGGSDPSIPNLVSENVIIRYNHMSRPMSWRDPIVAAPTKVTAAPLTGGALPPNTYGYRVVARRLVGSGATARSAATAETHVDVLGGAGAVGLSWRAVPDATDYLVYRRTPDGASQYWTVNVPSFTDTGAAGRAGTVPSGTGDRWLVKNLFELKNARNVVVEYNVFENNWRHGQAGYAILFTPRNQDGRCTWCVVEDVTFQYNIVRNVAAGINILGVDNLAPSGQTNNIRVRHNLFADVRRDLGGTGWFMLVGDGPRDIVVDHNTIEADGTTVLYVYGGPESDPTEVTGFRFTNNAARHSRYGINGTFMAFGTGILSTYFPRGIVTANWLQGGAASRYPTGNLFAGTFEDAFVGVAAGDFRPAPGGILVGRATDGSAIGADIATLLAETRPVIGGLEANKPTPPANLRIAR
jgi:hypothetical protein